MKVLIGGDVVPTESNFKYFFSNDFFRELDPNFQERWENVDIKLFNLECPIGKREELNPIKKSGPNLIAPEMCINGLKSLNPNLICLANNHILDYGVEGLNNTLNLLKDNRISTTGIIENINSELEAEYFTNGDVKIGIYNLCETEFCNATDNHSGTNPYKGIETYHNIRKIKENCDFLIIVYHGGKEFYRFPSPELKNRCENFIDFGADFVTCQHSHCIGSEEKYHGGTILYGQGNFIFDRRDDEFWNSGLLVELDVDKRGYSVEYVLLEKSNGLFKISSNNSILNDFYERSNNIRNNEFVSKEYDKFSDKLIDEYIEKLEYHNIFDKVFHRIFKKYPKRKYNESFYLTILNTVRCEAHREVFIRGLERKVR